MTGANRGGEARSGGGGQAHPLPLGVIVVDHGSTLPEANRATERLVESLQQRLHGVVLAAAHMELASPGVADAFALCVAAGVSQILVMPLFITPGKHLGLDIPGLLEAAASGAARPVSWSLLPPLAETPEFVDMLASVLTQEVAERAP